MLLELYVAFCFCFLVLFSESDFVCFILTLIRFYFELDFVFFRLEFAFFH